jgi:hypothetical protein
VVEQGGDLAVRRSAYAEAIAHLERALRLANGSENAFGRRLSSSPLQITCGNAFVLGPGRIDIRSGIVFHR